MLPAGCPWVSHSAFESLSFPFWKNGNLKRIFAGLQIMCAQRMVDIKLNEKGSECPRELLSGRLYE